MIETGHNLLFQEANLADTSGGADRQSFLQRVPSQRKIDAFLKARDNASLSPRFAEFFDLQMAVFVAAGPAGVRTRVVVAGVTNVTQKQFDQLAAVIGRGTARWNRAEFKRDVESILGISVKDPSGPAR